MKPFRHVFFIWGWPLLAQDNPLVLLDEPTTWLDINYQVELMKLMRELQTMGKTVFTVLHDLNQASRYCDHLVVLEGGTGAGSGPGGNGTDAGDAAGDFSPGSGDLPRAGCPGARCAW